MKQGDLVRINLPGRLKQIFSVSKGTTPDGSLGVVMQSDDIWAHVLVNGRCSWYERGWLELIESQPQQEISHAQP